MAIGEVQRDAVLALICLRIVLESLVDISAGDFLLITGFMCRVNRNKKSHRRMAF